MRHSEFGANAMVDPLGDGGGINCYSVSTVSIDTCTIYRNSASRDGGGVYLTNSPTTITGCTIVGNSATTTGGGIYQFDQTLVVTRTIIALTQDGEALYKNGGSLTMSCSDIYGNVEGDGAAAFEIGSNGNFAASPAFCNEATDEYTLLSCSPCLPANSGGCDLVGSKPLGCTYGPVIHVPAEYATIQAAIDVACPGDSVLIADGTYTGTGNRDLDFGGKDLVVMSASDDPSLCIIDCDGDTLDPHRGFYYHSGETSASVVQGFTITNGFVTTLAPGGENGGGISCTGGSSPSIVNCIITGNTAYDADPWTNPTFGGGISCEGGSSPLISGCTITDNRSSYNSGGIGSIDSSPQIYNCVIAGDSAGFRGGGMAFTGTDGSTDVIISNCLIAGNRSSDGGGIAFKNATAFVDSCTITGNWADSLIYLKGGGGLLVYNYSDVTVTNTIIWGNDSPTGAEIHVVVAETSNLEFSCSNVNSAGIDGPVVWNTPNIDSDPVFCNPESWASAPTMDGEYTLAWCSPCAPANSGGCGLVGAEPVGCTFGPVINVPGDFATIQAAIDAACEGDTVLIADGTYTGAGNRDLDFGGKDLVVMSASDDPSLCIIDCAASSGDQHRGFWFHGAETPDARVQGITVKNGYIDYGGGIRCQNSSNPTIANCIFLDNHATVGGGGIRTDYCGPSFISCLISGNSSDHHAGGAHLTYEGSPSFEDCIFSYNTAQYGGGAKGRTYLGVGGGAFTNCVFHNNEATVAGGGLQVMYRDIAVTNCTFERNTSPTGASVACSTSANLTILNSILANGLTGEALYADASANSIALSYCDLYGNAGGDWIGVIAPQLGTNGNISADPRFAYECPCFAGTAIEDSLHLCYDSPCIDTGDPALTDLDGSISEMGAYWYDGAGASARFLSVDDVPNDQGRKVRVSWTASIYDDAGCIGDSLTITSYSVYRRVDALPNEGWPAKAAWPDGDWDHVADVPALGELTYGAVVPTLIDSIAGRDSVSAYSTYFVAALTPDPLVSYYSLPVSGYSIDNLPPAVPGGFKADPAYQAILVSWDQNHELDFDRYVLYRGETSGFDPETATWTRTLSSMDEISFLDETVTSDPCVYYYRIAAFDINGNKSDYAGEVYSQSVNVTDGDNVPSAFALHGNIPNPFNPTTTIHFAVPSEGMVRISVLDVSGRVVRVLTSDKMTAGEHEVVWDGKDESGREVNSGIYFARMEAESFAATRKMVLLK